MKLVQTRNTIEIIMESDVDRAFVEDTLGMVYAKRHTYDYRQNTVEVKPNGTEMSDRKPRFELRKLIIQKREEARDAAQP